MSDETIVLNENDDIEKFRDENEYILIGTHNGIFHCDEVTACAILDLLIEKITKKHLKNAWNIRYMGKKKIIMIRTG